MIEWIDLDHFGYVSKPYRSQPDPSTDHLFPGFRIKQIGFVEKGLERDPVPEYNPVRGEMSIRSRQGRERIDFWGNFLREDTIPVIVRLRTQPHSSSADFSRDSTKNILDGFTLLRPVIGSSTDNRTCMEIQGPLADRVSILVSNRIRPVFRAELRDRRVTS